LALPKGAKTQSIR